jgi:HSP20 family protein
MLPVNTNLLPTVPKFFEDDWNNIFDWTSPNFKKVNTTLPSVNIEETKDEFIIEMAAPGMNKEEFRIELKNNILFVQGESKTENKEDKNSYYNLREFNYCNFKRSFKLNSAIVDHQKIEASYNNGILCIKIAKQEQAKEKPVIQISVK